MLSLKKYINSNNIQEIKNTLLTISDSDLNKIDTKTENTILMDTIYLDKDNIAKLLIDSKKLDLDKFTKNGNALISAIDSRNFGMIRYLIENGANPNLETPVGLPICYAIKTGEIRVIQELLKYISNPNDIVCERGNNLITSAMIKIESIPKREKIIEMLLDAGVNPFTYNDDNKSILELSINNFAFEILNLLEKKGYDINFKIPYHNTILNYILEKDPYDDIIIDQLISRTKHNLGTQNDKGNTPLMLSRNGYIIKEMTELMSVDDINIQNSEGDTALHIFVENDFPEVVNLLLQRGADKNIKNNLGNTPIDLIKSDEMYKVFGIKKEIIKDEDVKLSSDKNKLIVGKNEYSKSSKVLGGSTKPILFVDYKNNPSWVVKSGNVDQNIAEYTSSKIYNLFNDVDGINTYSPETYLTSDRELISKYIEGNLIKDYDISVYENDIRNGLIVDALLANWDFIGLDRDNMIVKNNKLYHIDNGSTFDFRAMGSKKEYGKVPLEIWSLREIGGQGYPYWRDDDKIEEIWTTQITGLCNKYDEIMDIIENSKLSSETKNNINYRLTLLCVTNEYISSQEEINILHTYPEIDGYLKKVYEKLSKVEDDLSLEEWAKLCDKEIREYFEMVENTKVVNNMINEMYYEEDNEDEEEKEDYENNLEELLENYTNKKYLNGDSLLQIAIQLKNYQVIKDLLESNQFDLRHQNDNGLTALLTSINTNDLLIFRQIFNTKFNGYPDIIDNNGNNALFYAVINDNTIILDDILTGYKKININHRNNEGNTAIMLVRDINMLERLLEYRDIDISIQNNEGNNLLMEFIKNMNYILFVRVLPLEKNINLENKEGYTALSLAYFQDNYEMVKKIINDKFDKIYFGLVNTVKKLTTIGHFSIIMMLLSSKSRDLLKLIIDRKIINKSMNLQYTNERGESALSLCLRYYNELKYYKEIIKEILSYYVKYNIGITLVDIMYINNLEMLNYIKERDNNLEKNKSYYNIVEYVLNLPQNIKKSLEDYTGSSYGDLNKKLRENMKLSDEERELFNSIKYAFLNVPPILQSINVYRGIYNVNELSKKTYNSTSLDKYVAFEFYKNRKDGEINCCMYNITIPVGSKVLFLEPISKIKSEKEILLDSNCQFSLSNINPNYKIGDETIECINVTYENFKTITLRSEVDISDEIMELQLSEIFELFISKIDLATEDSLFENISNLYRLNYPFSPAIKLEVFNKVVNKMMQTLKLYTIQPLPTLSPNYLSIMSYNLSWEALEGVKGGIDMKYCNKDDINVCRKNIADIITNVSINYVDRKPFDFIALQEVNINNPNQWDKLIELIRETNPYFDDIYNYSFYTENKAGVMLIYSNKFTKLYNLGGNFDTEDTRLYNITVFKEGIIYINVQFPRDFYLEYLDVLRKALQKIPEYFRYDYQVILSGDFNNDYTEYISSILNESERIFYISKNKLYTCCNPRKSQEISMYDMSTDHIYTTINFPTNYSTLNSVDINRFTEYGIAYMSDHLPVFELLKLD